MYFLSSFRALNVLEELLLSYFIDNRIFLEDRVLTHRSETSIKYIIYFKMSHDTMTYQDALAALQSMFPGVEVDVINLMLEANSE
jgi:hypothetical protein